MSPLLVILIAVLPVAALGVTLWWLWRRLGAERKRIQRQAKLSLALGPRLLESNGVGAVLSAALETARVGVDAPGASFVPFDEFRPLLPAQTSGHVPAVAQHALGSPVTRQVCKTCAARESGPACVLLQDDPDLRAVRCFALRVQGRPAGVVNLFFASPRDLFADEHDFLSGLVLAVEHALDGLQAHERELSALEYYRTAGARREDLPSMLAHLLESLHEAFGIDLGMVWVPESEGLQPGAWVQAAWPREADPASIDEPLLSELWAGALRAGRIERLEDVDLGSGQSWLSLLSIPLSLQGESPAGLLLLGSRQPREFTPPQMVLLQTVAEQTAMLVQAQRALSRVEFRAVVDERSRLAREIHDGLAQTLAFMKMETARMQSQLAEGELDGLAGRLRSLSETLADAYLDARLAIDSLRQVPQACFSDWLQVAGDDFQTATGIPVTMEVQPPVQPFSPEITAQAVRIVQEAFSNIRKHAAAGKVAVHAGMRAGDYVIEIGDDGRGFSPPPSGDRMHYGLRCMRERADQAGAEFQVTSLPGQGTTVRLAFPGIVREVK